MYAWERLAESGIQETIRERHLRYYLALAEVVHGARHGPEQVMRLAQLEAEHDNLRAALGWAREADNPESGLRLAVALRLFWEARGHVSEGRRWLEELLALAGSGAPDLRATALNTAGWLAETQRDFRRACELGDQRIMADALNRMGWIMIGQATSTEQRTGRNEVWRSLEPWETRR
jgi:hypothetical protein